MAPSYSTAVRDAEAGLILFLKSTQCVQFVNFFPAPQRHHLSWNHFIMWQDSPSTTLVLAPSSSGSVEMEGKRGQGRPSRGEGTRTDVVHLPCRAGGELQAG